MRSGERTGQASPMVTAGLPIPHSHWPPHHQRSGPIPPPHSAPAQAAIAILLTDVPSPASPLPASASFQQVAPCPRGHLILGFKAPHEPAPTHLSKSLYGSYSALRPEVPTKCLLSTQSLYVGKVILQGAGPTAFSCTVVPEEANIQVPRGYPTAKPHNSSAERRGGHSYHLPPAR